MFPIVILDILFNDFWENYLKSFTKYYTMFTSKC